jgi:putative Mg2+ transporter-C (MgtC) family protein
MEWLEYLRELNLLSCIVRILLTMFLGGVLGVERGRKKRPAGMRTYMLVSIGSTLVMMTNQYITNRYQIGDPTRLGAQVISGIGFLGAGTILMTSRNQIKGITTAAGLWTAACAGLAIGTGFYEGALVGGIAIYVTMIVMHDADNNLRKHSQVIEVYLEFSVGQQISSFLEYTRECNFEVCDIQIIKSKITAENIQTATILIKSLQKRTHEEMMEILGKCKGILHLEEI